MGELAARGLWGCEGLVGFMDKLYGTLVFSGFGIFKKYLR